MLIFIILFLFFIYLFKAQLGYETGITIAFFFTIIITSIIGAIASYLNPEENIKTTITTLSPIAEDVYAYYIPLNKEYIINENTEYGLSITKFKEEYIQITLSEDPKQEPIMKKKEWPNPLFLVYRGFTGPAYEIIVPAGSVEVK